MKRSYQFISTLLLCLPLVGVSLLLSRLPARLPVHLGEDGQPDRFVSRQAWFSLLTNVMLGLLLIRMGFIALLSRRLATDAPRFIRLYLLSATLVGSVPGLFVLWTLYPSPVFIDLVPVIVTLVVAGAVYWTIPAQLPATDERAGPNLQPEQRAVLADLHTLSRWVVVRVNLLAALLMLFARSSDRWTIAILANLLAFIALSIIAGVRSRQSG